MKRKNWTKVIWPILLAALWPGWLLAAPLGTAITYQGRLTAGGGPANGFFDLRLALYDASILGNQVGTMLTNSAVLVSNGLFTTSLDFGAGLFSGTNYWLDIGVRLTGGGTDFSPLLPRRMLAAAPYALFAANANQAATAATATTANAVAPSSVTAAGIANATLTAGKIANGQVVKSLNGLTDAVTLSAGTNVNLSVGGNTVTVSAHPGNDWRLGGNTGTTPGTDYLGTADPRALELRVNAQRALRLEPNAISPNLIGGVSGNFVAGGIEGATIAGGGTAALTNRVTGPLGAIGGGGGNSATASRATVSGGEANTAGGSYASVGGGILNDIGANSTAGTIGGGEQNSIAANTIRSTIGGGHRNAIASNTANAVISGGATNSILTNSYGATISGGASNVIGAYSPYGTIGGGFRNGIEAVVSDPNDASTIGGGEGNVIGNGSDYSFIGGGFFNLIEDFANYATISGGISNVVQTEAHYSTIAGGWNNRIESVNLLENQESTISGGRDNTIEREADVSVIAGGRNNRIGENGDFTTIGGGRSNVVSVAADHATIPGGFRANATNYGQFAYASGSFAIAGDAQTSIYVLRTNTSGAATNELFLDGIGQRMRIPNNGRWTFDALVIASFGPGATNSGAKSWQIRGAIKNVAGVTSMLTNSPTATELGEDPGTEPWTAFAFADNTNDALVIRVSGSLGTTLRWVATVRTVELIY